MVAAAAPAAPAAAAAAAAAAAYAGATTADVLGLSGCGKKFWSLSYVFGYFGHFDRCGSFPNIFGQFEPFRAISGRFGTARLPRFWIYLSGRPNQAQVQELTG